MRNPSIIETYADLICTINFATNGRDSLKEILPLEKDKLFFLQVLKEWGPKLETNIPNIIEALEADGTQQKNIDIVREVEK